MRKVNKSTFVAFLEANNLVGKGMSVTVADPPLLVYEIEKVIVAKMAFNRDGTNDFYTARPEGYYRTKQLGSFHVGRWLKGDWYMTGDNHKYKDNSFEQIDNEPLEVIEVDLKNM